MGRENPSRQRDSEGRDPEAGTALCLRRVQGLWSEQVEEAGERRDPLAHRTLAAVHGPNSGSSGNSATVVLAS